MRRAALVGVLLAAAVITAVAATQEIQRDGVRVMAGPGSFYPKVGDLAKGARVEVGGSRGPWLQVAAGALSGFIPASALEKGRSEGQAASAGTIGTSEASVSSDTAAVKGFGQGVESSWAQGRGQDWSGVRRLDEQRVGDDELVAFLRERGLLFGEVAP
jgi:uncharacterized protein YraI